MNWRLWSWLDASWLPLLVVIVRICWLWPWMEMLRRWLTPSFLSPLLPFWSIPLFFLGGALLTRTALARTGSLLLARLWVVCGGLVVLLGTLWWQYGRGTYALWDVEWLRQVMLALAYWQTELPPPFLTMILVSAIWLRSVIDGQTRLSRDAVWSTFKTGVIALVLLILASQLDPRGLPPNADRWMVALFATGLSALALSSLELSAFSGFWEAQRQPQVRLNRYWLASVAFVIAALLVVGLALGALLSPEIVASALSWITVLLGWLGTILGFVLQGFVYVLFLFLTPLYEWIRARLANSELPDPPDMPDFSGGLEPLADRPAVVMSPMAVEYFRWIGVGGLILGTLVLFALALRYFRTSRNEELDETRETIFTRELLEEQLSSLWHKWMQRLPHAKVAPYLSLEGEQETRREIRTLYQALLAQAKSLGHPRLRSQTPTEYRAYLANIYAGTNGAWHVMTELYLVARYSLHAPSAEQVEKMRRAWQAVQSALTNPATRPHAPDGSTADHPPVDQSGSADRDP